MNHHAIPRQVWQKMEEENDAKKNGRTNNKKIQQNLQFETVTGPREFTRAGILQAVTKLIATNNQVSVKTVIKI